MRENRSDHHYTEQKAWKHAIGQNELQLNLFWEYFTIEYENRSTTISFTEYKMSNFNKNCKQNKSVILKIFLEFNNIFK